MVWGNEVFSTRYSAVSCIDDDRDSVPDLSKHCRAYVADFRTHPGRGDGSDVLALRGRDGTESIVIIGFDNDLGATVADRARERNHLDDVRAATEDPLSCDDDSGPAQPRLGTRWRAEIEIDDVTRRQRRARQVHRPAASRRGRVR